MMGQYYRLCKGLNSKGILIPDTENIYDHIKDKTKDHYISLYKYNEKHKEIFDEKKSVSGITDTTTNRLLWDFDAENDFENVRSDTLILISRLESHGIDADAIGIYFSGNKGTHVSVNLKQSITPEEFKRITSALAKDLESYDSTVSNPARIIRVAHTKHQSSDLYKVPLSYKQLEKVSIEAIRQYATSDRPTKQLEIVNLPPSIIPEDKTEPKETSTDINTDLDIDYDQKPNWLSYWKFALLHGYFPTGTRSYALMILAATYRGQGLPKEVAYHACKGAAELQAKRFDDDKFEKEQIYNNIIEQVYSPTWNNGTYSEDNFPLALKKYLDKLGVPRKLEGEVKNSIISVSSLHDTFRSYAENIEANTIELGIQQLDKNLKITTSMLVGMLGCPASGKTASLLHILKHLSKKDQASLFFSLDMGKPLVYQKLCQNVMGYSSDELFKIYTDRDIDKIQKMKEAIHRNYKNVNFSFKCGASPQDIKNYIVTYQDTTGLKVPFVAIDYLEKIKTPYSDPNASSGYAAACLQEIANDLDTCVFVLLQPSKITGNPSDPIESYRSIKGASVIEQDCRVILSLYREGYSPKTFEDDNYITYSILKNTMGKLGTYDCGWDGARGIIRNLADVERMALDDLRQQKRQEKENKNSW